MDSTGELENGLEKKTDIVDDKDLNLNMQALLERIDKLENEKQQILGEFGHQRAKMKELYLQKEEELKQRAAEQNRLQAEVQRLCSELDEAKSQLLVAGLRLENELQEEKRKCQEEIASLQQVVQDTVEESTSSRSKYESEMKHIRRENERLENEVHELKALLQQQQAQQGASDRGEAPPILAAPGVMLSAVTKTIARKVVSQLGAEPPSSQDNLEDSMRKAQEDAEVLRSLVIPLEEEIQALKEKLRHTDELLRKYEGDTAKDDSLKSSEDAASIRSREGVLTSTQNVVSAEQDVSPNRDVRNAANQETEVLQSFPIASSSPKVNIINTSVGKVNEMQSSGPHKLTPESHSPITEDIVKSHTDAGSDKDGESLGSPVSQGKQQQADSTPLCDMCSNYEAQLVRAQQHSRELEKQVATLERTVERLREDLAKESNFRKDMEEKWNEKKEEHKIQVADLKKRVEEGEETLKELRQTYIQMCGEVMDQLANLTQQREQVQERLDRLQKENDNLLGKHSAHSQQLQNEMINWPNKVEELQELLLKFYEELITAKVAKETLEEQEKMLKCEMQLLRDQMNSEREEWISIEDNLTQELHHHKSQLNVYEKERLAFKRQHEQLEKLVKSSQKTASDFEAQLTEALRIKSVVQVETSGDLSRMSLPAQHTAIKNLQPLVGYQLKKKQQEEQIVELKSQVTSLQQELDNSEAVQKDFVRLSQSLQVQLEHIREADTQVRWQHDEDIEECQSCKTGFTFTRSKQHCRHCGRIFCLKCLSHTVTSGPNNRPSKVCDVCHTLLVPDTAPYFSTEPPHTPD